MHRQLQDMVEEPRIAEIPSTEEGIDSGKLLILLYIMYALYSIENKVNANTCRCLCHLNKTKPKVTSYD